MEAVKVFPFDKIDAEDTNFSDWDEDIVNPPSAPDANNPNFLKLCWLNPSNNSPEFNMLANSFTDFIPSPGSVPAELRFILFPSDKLIDILEKPLIWLSWIPKVADDCLDSDENLISFVFVGIVANAPSLRNSVAKSGFVDELKTSSILDIEFSFISDSVPIILSSALLVLLSEAEIKLLDAAAIAFGSVSKKVKADAFDNEGLKENWSPSDGIPIVFNLNPSKSKLSAL